MKLQLIVPITTFNYSSSCLHTAKNKKLHGLPNTYIKHSTQKNDSKSLIPPIHTTNRKTSYHKNGSNTHLQSYTIDNRVTNPTIQPITKIQQKQLAPR
jgi:hypothetical protein